MANLPKITVIIPVRNEEKFIDRTLRYVQEQEYPSDRLEIIVVDGCSEDRTAKIVEEYAAIDHRIRLLRNPRQLSSSARNLGVRNATGDIILFIDGHVYIDNRQLLHSTAELLEKKDAAVLSRPQLLDTPDNTLFQKAVSLARKSLIGHGPESTIYTDRNDYVDPTSAGATYRRELFGQVGYFDERFDACEDLELNYRVSKAGFRAFTSMKLAVYYYPRASLKALFKQMKRYGVGRLRMMRKYPATTSLGTIIPALFVLGLIALPLAAFLWSGFGYLFLFLYGLYFLLILTASLIVSFKRGFVYLPFLLLIYPIIHIGLGWGFLCELTRTVIGRGIDFSQPQSENLNGKI